METPKLTEWLRANSSGCYGPSAEAADKIEELERKLAVARRGLEKLACLGNEDRRGTSYGNSVAIDALKRIDETL